MRISIFVLVGAMISFTAGGVSAIEWYGRGHGRPPAGDKVYVCHGYMCRIVTGVRFSAAEIATIAGALRTGADGGAAERAAISNGVQIFEKIVGARIGTASDRPKMQFGRGTSDQMDCIDEATNTSSFLMFLAEHGYLNHHRVEEPTARGFFVDLRYPHATAVLTDLATGEKWAIDSWPRANAEPPVIQRLSEWKRARRSE
jgi:hypothetical protein